MCKMALLGGLLAACLAVPVRAEGVYCLLSDGLTKRAFVSDVRRTDSLHPQRMRKVASRFRRSVNGEYSTFFVTDSGICHRFASVSTAELSLGVLREDLQRLGFTFIIIGSF